jgi:PAS domain S-box-containing protein
VEQNVLAPAVEAKLFPAGGGEMGARIRNFDWSRTALGAISRWPQYLKTTVDIILQSPVPMVTLWGRDGIMVYNDAYTVVAGGRHPELLGSKLLEGWPEVAAFNRHVMDVGLRGQTLCFRDEHLVLFRSGMPEDVWLNLDYSPLLDESGQPVGVMAIVIETTQRVRAERALKTSEAQFRTFANALPNHVWSATPDGHVDWLNRQLLDYTGLRQTQNLSQRWRKVVHPDDRERTADAWAKALKCGEVFQSDVRLKRRDGEYRWHLSRATPIREADGAILRWIGTNTDIDDQIRTERALRDREADLARVQKIGKVGGVEVHLVGGFHNRRSPEYLAIHGLKPEDAYESHEDWVRRIHPEDRERTEQAFIEAVHSTATDYSAEYRIIRPNDGELRWIAVKAEIERDATGKAIRLVGAHIDITERKIAEQALRESERRFRLVSESAPVMLWMADTSGKCLYINRRLREFWGVAQEDVPAFDWQRTIHPGDVPALMEIVLRAMAERTGFTAEARYRGADGEYRTLHTTAQPRFGANGAFLGMIGVNVDITEQRASEKALKESEERFRLIANSAPVPMWVSRLDGKRAFVNQAYQDFLGLPYDDCLVFDWRKALHPEDLDRILAEQIAGESSRKPFALEARYRRADGSWRWLRSESQPRWGIDGQHIGFIGVAHDITAAKQAEIELRGLNERLEALVAARTRERDRIWTVSQDLLIVADINGIWLNVNPAVTATLGWSEDELIGRTSEWLEHPEDSARTRQLQKQLTLGNRISRFENRLHHKDGSYRWISWTAVPHEGQIYAVARDVTDEKEAAETLHRTEEALRQSQKMEAVGQLTGGIAHDFNNLLQGIIGSLEQVRQRAAQGRLEEIERFLSGAMGSANRAAALTHRLLAFSRRQPLDPKTLNVNPLIQSMEDLLRRTLGERLTLDLRLEPDLGFAHCDQNQLENAILNLVINARDAMPDGGTVTIETYNLAVTDLDGTGVAPGDYVALLVRDTGIGMPPDVKARAFDPFFTTKPLGQGTGLGLSMIYGFVRQSDGYVKIDSDIGAGTTVRIILPRVAPPVHAPADTSPVEPQPGSGKGRTVLVIEDEALVRLLVVDALAEMGFDILEAKDGPQGLEILQSSRPIDLLVTDVGLPGLNGRQVADAARLVRPGLKVLFMTGYAENATTAKDLLAPGMQIIAKPFAMDVLARRVRELTET